MTSSAFHTAVRCSFRLPGAACPLHASGASFLRVALSPTAEHTIACAVADETGRLVASVDSLTLREIPAEQLAAVRGAHHDSLFCVDSVPVPAVDWAVPAGEASPAAAGGWVLLGADVHNGERPAADPGAAKPVALLPAGGVLDGGQAHADLWSLGEAVDGGAPVPEMVLVDLSAGESLEDTGPPEVAHEAVNRVLGLLQIWLSDQRFSEAATGFLDSRRRRGGGRRAADRLGVGAHLGSGPLSASGAPQPARPDRRRSR